MPGMSPSEREGHLARKAGPSALIRDSLRSDDHVMTTLDIHTDHQTRTAIIKAAPGITHVENHLRVGG